MRAPAVVGHAWGLVFPADAEHGGPRLGMLENAVVPVPAPVGGYEVIVFATRAMARQFVHALHSGRVDIAAPEVVRLRVTVEVAE